MPKRAGVILAGGKSSRMGQNKALLPWRSMRLIDHMAQTLKEAGLNGIYASGAIDGYPNIRDLVTQKGPVGGICSTVLQLSAVYQHLLFIPVDMPLLSANVLSALLADAQNFEARYFAGYPLPCLLHASEELSSLARDTLENMKNDADYSVQRFLGLLGATALETPEMHAGKLTNINTPQQWREASGETAHQR